MPSKTVSVWFRFGSVDNPPNDLYLYAGAFAAPLPWKGLGCDPPVAGALGSVCTVDIFDYRFKAFPCLKPVFAHTLELIAIDHPHDIMRC